MRLKHYFLTNEYSTTVTIFVLWSPNCANTETQILSTYKMVLKAFTLEERRIKNWWEVWFGGKASLTRMALLPDQVPWNGFWLL